MEPWGERLGYRYKKPRWAILSALLDYVAHPCERINLHRAKSCKFGSLTKFLVIRLDHLGDLLCSFPAIRALRNSYPNAYISLLVGPWCIELAQLNPHVDEIVVFRAPWFDRAMDRAKGIAVVAQLIAGAHALRKRHFDCALDMRGDLRNIMLMWLAHIPFRIGYDDVGGKFLLTHPIKRNRWQHETHRSMDVVRAIGCRASDDKLTLRIPPKARYSIKHKLAYLNSHQLR